MSILALVISGIKVPQPTHNGGLAKNQGWGDEGRGE